MTVLYCLVVSGCALFPKKTDDDVLDNDGVVEGQGGLLLGAMGTALAAPLQVWIEEVEAPSEPLSEFATAISSYYRFGAAETTSALEGSNFALAIPVPASADTATLGVAVLVPSNRVLDGPAAGDVWIPVSGAYEGDGNFFSIVVDALFAEGSTVVLIQHPDMEPIVAAAPVAIRSAASTLDVQFDVKCHGFGLLSSGCTKGDEERFAADLKRAYDAFAAFGYVDVAVPDRPYLRYKCVFIESAADGFQGCDTEESPRYRDIRIYPPTHKACASARGGLYNPETRSMIFCYPDTAVEDYQMVASHELFHAFQNGFPNVRADWERYKAKNGSADNDWYWIIEGTAAAVESLAPSLQRTSRLQFRSIDWALTHVYDEDSDLRALEKATYRTQDFWVYLGLAYEIGIGDLTKLFEKGADTADVDAFLAGEAATSSLADQYWAWVINQGWERSTQFPTTPFLEGPCSLDQSLARAQEVIHPSNPEAVESFTRTLSRLTSELVFVHFTTKSNLGPLLIRAEKTGGIGELKYKIYLLTDTECGVTGQNLNNPARRVASRDGRYPSVIIIFSNVGDEKGDKLEYTTSIRLL